MRTTVLSLSTAVVILSISGCATGPIKKKNPNTGNIRVNDPADERTFRTKQKAPPQFTEWTFFWEMPEIDPDATLDYVVIQPDGEEYYHLALPIVKPGARIRSDFSKEIAGGDPKVFQNEHVVFKIRVDKGTIRFGPESRFQFEFRHGAGVSIGVEAVQE